MQLVAFDIIVDYAPNDTEVIGGSGQVAIASNQCRGHLFRGAFDRPPFRIPVVFIFRCGHL